MARLAGCLSLGALVGFFRETDNINLIFGFIAIMLIFSLALPPVLEQVFPDFGVGPECSSLPHPPGGNQRSLLAIYGDNQQELQLELTLLNEDADAADDTVVDGSNPLRVRVTFINEDTGPIYLYWRENEDVVRSFESAQDTGIVGLGFEIRAVDAPSEAFLNDNAARPGRTEASIQSFDLEDIYILKSKHRCMVEIEFTRDRLNRIGVQPGQKYQIRAYYRNGRDNTGIQQHAVDATATPMFESQGVWWGSTRSETERFTLEPPGI
jgi:hypothetical protein